MKVKFSSKHEWINEYGYIGITDFAQNALSDIVFVELPKIGDKLDAGKTFGSVESVKAVSEIYAPVSGTVTEINEALEDAPELLNQDALANWIVKIEFADTAEFDRLMGEEEYKEFCENEK